MFLQEWDGIIDRNPRPSCPSPAPIAGQSIPIQNKFLLDRGSLNLTGSSPANHWATRHLLHRRPQRLPRDLRETKLSTDSQPKRIQSDHASWRREIPVLFNLLRFKPWAALGDLAENLPPGRPACETASSTSKSLSFKTTYTSNCTSTKPKRHKIPQSSGSKLSLGSNI